jgi:hypothetical protein
MELLLDTGSTITWVNSHPIDGNSEQSFDNPSFRISPETLLNCQVDKVCTKFQRGHEGCKMEDGYRCNFQVQYLDGSMFGGVIVRDNVQITSNDGTILQVNMVFG